MEELKKCPLCGEEAELHLDEDSYGIGIIPQCSSGKCRLRGKTFSCFQYNGAIGNWDEEESKRQATLYWNQRTQ
jgi:hypothetical protein